MTHRELRQLLNEIGNKGMSIWSLRQAIFLLEDPDSEVTTDSIKRAEQTLKTYAKPLKWEPPQ